MENLLDLGEFTGNEDEGSGFSPIDSGRYRVTVFELTREVGKSSGKPYLKWCFQVCEGEPFAGRRIWDNTSLSDNAKWRLVQVLKACGIDVPKGHLKLNPNDLLGRELILNVGQEPDDYRDPDGDEGIMRNVVKGFAPVNTVSKPKIQIPDAPAPKAKKVAKKAVSKAPKEEEPKAEASDEAVPFDEDDDFDFE